MESIQPASAGDRQRPTADSTASTLARDKIPRLDEVCAILRYTAVRFDGSGSILPLAGEDIPLGARLLKVALDFDELRTAGFNIEDTLGRMMARQGVYDPAVLEDFAAICRSAGGVDYRELYLKDVREGMVFADDVGSRTSGRTSRWSSPSGCS